MRMWIVDAFTDRPFSGNPAGVVLLDSFPAADRLQQIAAELNLSETAFAHPLPPGGAEDWALRWFTPVTEVDLCGHATLATAHILAATGHTTGPVRFASRGGTLVAGPGPAGAITLDFPSTPPAPVAEPPGLADALGAPALSTHLAGGHTGDLLVEVADEDTVRSLAPEHRSLGPLAPRGVLVTARAADPTGPYDYVSRCFFPNVGIDEDPVTGSAHTALGPFWSGRLGRPALTGFQASARGGLVGTELRGGRTLLTGRAVTVIEGALLG